MTRRVVLGAHYDHVGRSTQLAYDPEQLAARLGADDNASGTAAVLALARRFAARPARRSILLANFGAEELGLVGSRVFVEHPPVPLDSIVAMLNFDMVGRMRGRWLQVLGVGSAPALRAIVASANAPAGVRLELSGSTGPISDHVPFAERGIPALHFFTGWHSDYHRVTDTADRLNYDGLLLVVEVAEHVARTIADLDTGACRAEHAGGARRASCALGIR